MTNTQVKSPKNGNFVDFEKIYHIDFFKITKYFANSHKRLEKTLSVREIVVEAIRKVCDEQ